VVGKISIQELQKAIVPLKCNHIVKGWMHGVPANVDAAIGEKAVYSILWD
jgi:hypothetical protein